MEKHIIINGWGKASKKFSNEETDMNKLEENGEILRDMQVIYVTGDFWIDAFCKMPDFLGIL